MSDDHDTHDGNNVDDDESRYLIGDQYDETAAWPIEKIADRLHEDLIAVQGDEIIRSEAAFVVDSDHSGPQPTIRITISGLRNLHDSQFPPKETVTLSTIMTAFGLASNYNRVERVYPENARFAVLITAITDDGTPYCVVTGTIYHCA